MNLCKGCEPGQVITSFEVHINRKNFCQMVTVFVRSWLRGDKIATLNLHAQKTASVTVDGKVIYSPPTVTVTHE
jgi:hypothetical protein